MTAPPAPIPLAPMYQFDVKEERVLKAIEAIRKVRDPQRPLLTQEQCVEVMYELGFGEGVSFNENGLQLNLTDLQWVAAAAAIAAAAEAGGTRSWQT